MSFLEKVYAKRLKLADVLREHLGIRKLVEQLYPDRAHFIYELLQNAEDAGATEASFWLRQEGLTFEHNGKPFSEEDVWRITDIGQSAKEHDQEKIGRFGVGFKAVFAYSETPHIWSSTFCFKIADLVLPTEIPRKGELGSKTCFEFPFNNPKKLARAAHAEIETGLSELAETTLLFLTNLNIIRWRSGDGLVYEVRRTHHSEDHVEVIKHADDGDSSAHFLRFTRPVAGLEVQRLAVAFGLDFLPGVSGFDRQLPLAKQVKVTPAGPGRVSVFFPAEKETSGLRFHMHAPFVPEVSRASIKETPTNEPLFQQLAQLVADVLPRIRDLGLLTVDFLGVLPNSQDEQVPPRYQCIRSAIVEAMNELPLTPTHGRSHAPAKRLLQAKASLKDLLSESDLRLLVGDTVTEPKWCAGVTQKSSNVDRFLISLAVHDWDFDHFFEALRAGTREGGGVRRGQWVVGPDNEFMAWMAGKSPEWHQRLYALLFTELGATGGLRQLADTQIIRLSTGTYSTPAKCFFPTDEVREDEFLPRVDQRVYTSGKTKSQQDNARKLLESIGVRDVGEAEHVQSILRQRYVVDAFRPQKQDLKRFVSLIEKDSTKAVLFQSFCILECVDGKWRRPKDIFLDTPFVDTGLSIYYGALGDQATKHQLASAYADCGIAVKRVVKFAVDIGVQTLLLPTSTNCRWNPEYGYLRAVAGERYTSPVDVDYAIPGLTALLERPTIENARFVWRTMDALPHSGYLVATYQKSGAGGARKAPSQLVHHLRRAAWVPQGDGVFVKPEDAQSTSLPAGFAFDAGARWLSAIEFGKVVTLRSESQRQRDVVVRELGFRDQESLERARRFAALPSEEQEKILAEREYAQAIDLPEREPANPERRAERVGLRAATAPERRTEERLRTISVGTDDLRDEARQYLRLQYTNTDGEMICQICKHRLPFRLEDGTDYFEAVEFLPELVKRHHQNYLALCPNHSAMFQHANDGHESLAAGFGRLSTNELGVVLAQKDLSIYFTKTHIADLREVIRVDAVQAQAASS